jgi:cell division protein FtsL
MHSRIEQVAAQQLQMQVPDAKRIQVVTVADADAVPQSKFNAPSSMQLESELKTKSGAAE